MSASDHTLDNGPHGMTGHTGKDKSLLGDRISRYHKWFGTTENISYGSFTGLSTIISLFVDSGVKNRGHRTAMINEKMKFCGIYTGNHTKF
jgi:uncharacterized protein YkwD